MVEELVQKSYERIRMRLAAKREEITKVIEDIRSALGEEQNSSKKAELEGFMGIMITIADLYKQNVYLLTNVWGENERIDLALKTIYELPTVQQNSNLKSKLDRLIRDFELDH